MPIWCRHEWEKKAETTVEPPLLKALERLIDRGEDSVFEDSVFLDMFNLSYQETVHVIVLACKKCGKLKTIRESAGRTTSIWSF